MAILRSPTSLTVVSDLPDDYSDQTASSAALMRLRGEAVWGSKAQRRVSHQLLKAAFLLPPPCTNRYLSKYKVQAAIIAPLLTPRGHDCDARDDGLVRVEDATALLVFTDNLHLSSCHASAVSPVFRLHRRVARMVVYDPELWLLSTSMGTVYRDLVFRWVLGVSRDLDLNNH
jgi:hypothetical protein